MAERNGGDMAPTAGANEITVFLCGDVMTGRGIDQIFPNRCDPRIYEPVLTSALDYVALAEDVTGPVPRDVGPHYVWGEALGVLDRIRPDVRIINLETSITTSDDPAPKGINYRMHPANVGVLTAAEIDCCVLANNHVLDWGEAGLLETLATLREAGLRMAGAGVDEEEARAPAKLDVRGGGRVLVFAVSGPDSGSPPGWRAGAGRPGIHLLPDYSRRSVAELATRIADATGPGDLAIASIHWGGNWGYPVPGAHRRFAHALIDAAPVAAIHGHSSHHPKAIEVYRDRPILYGSGDFLSDYEGITGYERFRDDLVVMYFVTSDAASGNLLRLRMVPLQVRSFRLVIPSRTDRGWLRDTLDRECRRFGRRVVDAGDAFVLE